MKAIVTKYRRPTDTRGGRIIADDGDGNRLSVRVNDAMNLDENQREAAKKLRLLAAAPELLAACKQAAEAAGKDWLEMQLLLAAAIDKAEGRDRV